MTNMLAAVARKRAGGGFTYTSTNFDANDGLTKSGGLTGIADSATGLISFWLKMNAGTDGDFERIIYNVGPFAVNRTNGDVLQIQAKNAASTDVLDIRSASDAAGQIQEADGWVHVIASWDLSTAGRRQIYIAGVSSMNQQTFSTPETIDYANGNDFKIGFQSAGVLGLNALVSEFYFTTEYLDLSVSGNRDKFRNSATNKPVNLGANGSTPTGTQPLIYLHNSFSTFQTNLGSGGNFTVTGALGDGGSDKP